MGNSVIKCSDQKLGNAQNRNQGMVRTGTRECSEQKLENAQNRNTETQRTGTEKCGEYGQGNAVNKDREIRGREKLRTEAGNAKCGKLEGNVAPNADALESTS